MKLFILALFILMTINACHQPGNQAATISTDSIAVPQNVSLVQEVPALFHYGHPLLLAYDQYVAGLNTDSIQSGLAAALKFRELFKDLPPAVCDTAFFIFNAFHETLLGSLQTFMNNDTTRYDPLILAEQNGHPPVISKKLQAFASNLKANGFYMAEEEGTPYADRDRGFIAKYFYGYVSRVMQQYLEQLHKEQKEGFEMDAGLMISPQQFAGRTVWWERFVKEHPQFLYTKSAVEWRKRLLTFLLHGMDNTPVLEEDKLSDYYQTAYTYVRKNFARSGTNELVGPYFDALVKKDTATANQLLDSYRKNGSTIF